MAWLLFSMVGCGWFDAPAVCEPPGTQVASPRAAGCLLVRDGRLLMVQGSNDRWSIPGGYVEAGESGPAAAVRETREEAGVEAVAGDPVCAVPGHGFVAYACTTSADAQPEVDGRETKDARFVERKDVRTMWLRFPAQRSAYLAVIDGATTEKAR